MRVLGVIPARGGSKGVKDKNIRLLHGKPLLGWTARAALPSDLTDLILSTDSEQIASVGREWKIEVPFIRPPELAADDSKSIDVMQHALTALQSQGRRYDAVMMLQPTTPFRNTNDINACIALLQETQADSVISVEEVEAYHPARMKFMERGFLVDPPFQETYENQPRQELAPMFIRNGAIYLTLSSVIMYGSFKGRRCAGYVMPHSRSVNIDSLEDFEYAEWLAPRNENL